MTAEAFIWLLMLLAFIGVLAVGAAISDFLIEPWLHKRRSRRFTQGKETL